MGNSSMVAGSSRRLPLRMRPDLIVQDQVYQGRNYRLIKDPLSLKYFRFEEEEFAILGMLDGQTTAEQIKRRFDRRFAPQRIALTEIQHFLGMLHSNSLLISGSAGQGSQLLKRNLEQTKKEKTARYSNILTIRFKGFDPDRLLNVLDKYLGWMFSFWATVLALVLCSSALILVLTQFEIFQSKLPGFHQFFGANNWALLALTVIVTKIIHEFGHGMACKRFGSTCHEMGVMMLVLMPCLYCNVSDSWTLPSKWRRMAIGAAGMYFELVIAAICTFLWWFSHPGIFNFVCLNVVFVSSVSTLLFNANPLLRYDGYYILSDLIEIPNLRQKASSFVTRQLAWICLGMEKPYDPFMPARQKWLFPFYALAAVFYRWFISFAIFWFLYNLLEPYGLKIFGQAIALMAIYGLIGQPLIQLFRFFNVPGRMEKVKKFRLAATLAVASVAIWFVLFVPIPHYIQCQVYVHPADGTPVYVETSGTVREVHVESNQPITKGAPILTLASFNMVYRIAEIEGKRDRAEAKLQSLYRRAANADEEAENELDTVEEVIRTLEAELDFRKEELSKLQVCAPSDGIVIPTSFTPKPKTRGRLPRWYGYPLDRQNIGAQMDGGVAVCQIVKNPERYRAVLLVSEKDLEEIRPDQKIEIVLDEIPYESFHTTIQDISNIELKSVPNSLSSQNGGSIVTVADADGNQVPQSSLFQVSAEFEDKQQRIVIGATGNAKIIANQQTIAQRLLRFAQQTFHFEL